jgi:predicted Zn-dependent protease
VSAERLPPAHEVVEAALERSSLDGCVVLVRERSSVNVRFAVNTTTSNGLRRSRDVTVISVLDGADGPSVGVVTQGGDVDVAALVGESEALARRATTASDAAPLVAGGADAAFTDGAPETSFDELRHVVAGLTTAFPEAARRGVTLAGFAEHELETTYLGTSTGLRRRHVQPTGQLQLNARSGRPGGSAWTSAGAASLRDVDVAVHVDEAHRRLEWGARTVELPAGRYEVILPPIAVADLVLYAYWTMSSRDAKDGRTVYSKPGGETKVGERLTPLDFSLHSDPGAPGLECAPFLSTSASSDITSVFDNGLDLARTDWIADGVLRRLFTPRADAARDGSVAAAPVDNLVLSLEGGEGSTEDLVRRTGRGLLLTSLWYIREVDPATLLLTGLTRDGVYLIEDGELVGGVNNYRFNESPIDVLARATEAGSSVRTMSREWGDEFNRTSMPALRIPDFNMSTVSPAS